jgi:ATP-dependent protease ClpP protease subunit
VIGKISIHGHIGPSYVDEQGVFHKGVVLLDIIDQVMSQSLATSFDVEVNSPGGFVDIGDDIYNYLVDVDKTRPVTTIQKGLVGSIATKIFLSGSKRLVDDRFEFWIHNPFKEKVTGDADQLRAEADSTEKTEKDIRKFYGTFSPMGDVAIDALMKQETGLTADQCIKYGFATGKVQAPVFNIIKLKNMSTPKKEDNSLRDGLLALLGIKPEQKKKGVAPKAAVPQSENKNVVINLADGAGQFWIQADVVAEGVAAFMLDESGQPTAEPLADGDYKDDKGQMITVTAGKIAKVMPGEEVEEEEEEEVVTDAKVEEKVNAAVAKIKAELKAENDAAILAMKKDVKLGVAPKKAVIQAPKGEAYTVRTIAQVQKERAEKNKAK